MSCEGSSVAHLQKNHKTGTLFWLAIRFLRFFVVVCNTGGCDVIKLLTASLACFVHFFQFGTLVPGLCLL